MVAKKVEIDKCPSCGCEDTISPRELTVRGYNLDFEVSVCANYSEHRKENVPNRDYDPGAYSELLHCIKRYRTNNGGTYGEEFSLKWGLDVKEKMPLIFENAISKEYERQLSNGNFGALKSRKGIDPDSLDFPNDFNLIDSAISIVDENKKYPDGTLLLDLSFNVEKEDGVTFRWSGYVTPENDVYPHYYTEFKID